MDPGSPDGEGDGEGSQAMELDEPDHEAVAELAANGLDPGDARELLALCGGSLEEATALALQVGEGRTGGWVCKGRGAYGRRGHGAIQPWRWVMAWVLVQGMLVASYELPSRALESPWPFCPARFTPTHRLLRTNEPTTQTLTHTTHPPALHIRLAQALDCGGVPALLDRRRKCADADRAKAARAAAAAAAGGSGSGEGAGAAAAAAAAREAAREAALREEVDRVLQRFERASVSRSTVVPVRRPPSGRWRGTRRGHSVNKPHRQPAKK